MRVDESEVAVAMTEKRDDAERSGEGGSLPRRANYLAVEPVAAEPEQLDEVLAALVARHAGPGGMAAAALLESWPEVAGAEWGAKSRAVSLRDGVLVVEVVNGAEATLLRYDEGSLRARIQARFGAGLVASIRVRVASSGGRR